MRLLRCYHFPNTFAYRLGPRPTHAVHHHRTADARTPQSKRRRVALSSAAAVPQGIHVGHEGAEGESQVSQGARDALS